MRQLKAWQRELSKAISAGWGDERGRQSANRLCSVELGLFGCEMLLFDESPQALWGLLTGYDLNLIDSRGWTEKQHRARAVLRHLLPFFHGPHAWEEDLHWYSNQPDYVRGYDLSDSRLKRRVTSIAPERFDVYASTLETAPPFSQRELKWASAGQYVISAGRRTVDVHIPAEWINRDRKHYTITPRPARPPLHVKWTDLVETAVWMDQQLEANSIEQQNYAQRISRIRLEIPVDNGFRQAEQLSVDGMLHLAGMLSSGKTTLMQILTVWAARQGQHVTLVLGDVVSVLEWAALFDSIGIDTAPVIGGYNRARHLNRMHRVEANRYAEATLKLEHPAFKWLGIVCPLLGTSHNPIDLEPHQLPCTRLQKPNELDLEQRRFYACPLYTQCGVHQAQRDLLNARVWVATPASLIYTRIPSQLNTESLRFGELVSQLSDLVIVDEADRVQTQLDATFSPSEVLAGSGGEPWLNQLEAVLENRIRESGRRTLAHPDVESWITVQRNTQLAADKIYALFLQESETLSPMRHDYFTGWTVWESLISEILSLVGRSVSEKNSNPEYERQMWTFNDFIRTPLDDSDTSNDGARQRLSQLSRELLSRGNLNAAFPRIQAELQQFFPDVEAETSQWAKWSIRFTFALMSSVLSWGVDHLTRTWELVKQPLELDEGNSSLFYNPPQDYDPVIPVAPMGNVLAFQYDAGTAGESGILRFFRVSGVGRAWMLNLHRLFSDEGKPGPNVILLSGTSWAGKSPLYHIQHPVGGILRTPDEEVEAIVKRSRFFAEWVVDNATDRFVRASGAQGAHRNDALDRLVKHFTMKLGPRRDGASRFEQVRDTLPDGRQRLLILVGSYAEAAYVSQSLVRARSDWDQQVLHLVRDDDNQIENWAGTSNGLQRGQVSRFARTDAWILVAPLLAIERGHNILNDEGQAAIGAAYFFVRPHPRPDDLTLPLAAINAWAVENGSKHWGTDLLSANSEFRSKAYARWRHWLQMPWIYSSLPPAERDMVTWTQLVTIWQVVGRLVRSGSPARIYFVDEAFGSKTRPVDCDPHGNGERVIQPGLLAEMRRVLAPYFSGETVEDGALVQTLYGPFYQALLTLGDV